MTRCLSASSPACHRHFYPVDYFAGVAGAAGVAGVAAAVLAAFLFFFTCFFVVVVGAELSVGAVCAARDNPAVASVRESPSNAAEIFFMVLSDSFVEALFFFCLCTY
jgi:hypothetical protein